MMHKPLPRERMLIDSPDRGQMSAATSVALKALAEGNTRLYYASLVPLAPSAPDPPGCAA